MLHIYSVIYGEEDYSIAVCSDSGSRIDIKISIVIIGILFLSQVSQSQIENLRSHFAYVRSQKVYYFFCRFWLYIILFDYIRFIIWEKLERNSPSDQTIKKFSIKRNKIKPHYFKK